MVDYVRGYSNDEAVRFVDKLPLSKRDKTVLREYARYANRRTHLSYPSNETIMRVASYKLRAIQQARKDLIDMGLLLPCGTVRRVKRFILSFKGARAKIEAFYMRHKAQNMHLKGAQNASINNKGEIIKNKQILLPVDFAKNKEEGKASRRGDKEDALLEEICALIGKGGNKKKARKQGKAIFQTCLKYCGGDRNALALLINRSQEARIKSPIAWLCWACKEKIYQQFSQETERISIKSAEIPRMNFAHRQFYKAQKIWMEAFRMHRDYNSVARQWGALSTQNDLPNIPLTKHAYENYYQISQEDRIYHDQ